MPSSAPKRGRHRGEPRGHNPSVTQHQPDPAPGAEPERGFLVAVLAPGADTDEALAAWGFTAEEIAKLREAGAVG